MELGEKSHLTRMSRLEKFSFRRKAKNGSHPEKVMEFSEVGQADSTIMLHNAGSQCLQKACTLTQQSLLTVLIQMESKGAMGQWPSIPAAEARRHTKPVEVLWGNLH